jgi:hypothetical protein
MALSRHWPTDEHGTLQNIGDRSKIQPAFQLLIDDAVQACLKHIEADLHSLYLIGSMARGEAQPGASDFDFVAVIEYQRDFELIKRDWLAPTVEHLSKTYSALVTDVEFDLWPQGYLFRDPAEFSPGAFLLATQSVCVWGSDLVPELPRYTLRHLPTLRAIANEDLLYFIDDMQEVEEDLARHLSPDDLKNLSRRVGKKIARAGFALALEQNRRYTRDVVQCGADFSNAYPKYAEAMSRAVSLYTQPINDGDKILKAVDGFVDWMLDKANDWLDVYNPDWEEFYYVGDEDEDDTDA